MLLKDAKIFCNILICILGCCSCSCEKQPQNYVEVKAGEKTFQISLVQLSDTHNYIKVETFKSSKLIASSTWQLNYPVYRFDVGDVTGDSIPEIAVGVIKTTRFDRNRAKRLFLFSITDENDVRPLWLGSRVAQPLEDFVLTKSGMPEKVLTIERERSGKFLVAAYRYHGFGLEFCEYIKREVSKKEAYKIIYKQIIEIKI